jgi:Meiosis protein SPO22/ZIP4 like
MLSQSEEPVSKTQEVVDILQRDYGSKLAVMLLRLEILSRDEPPDPNALREGLSKVIRLTQITESNLKAIFHYVHKLRRYALSDAYACLKQLLVQRLVIHGNECWIERAIITLIWICTSTDDQVLTTDDVRNTLIEIHKAWPNSMSAEATHGALVVSW